MAGKTYISRWLIDMLESGPYTDERETRAENQRIRANPHETVDKIWAEQEKRFPAPPPLPPVPLPQPPDWGNSPPPAPIPAPPPLPPAPPVATPAPVFASGGNGVDVETDPGIGPVAESSEPIPSNISTAPTIPMTLPTSTPSAMLPPPSKNYWG